VSAPTKLGVVALLDSCKSHFENLRMSAIQYLTYHRFTSKAGCVSARIPVRRDF
jgi:hypothetical protein